MTTDELIKLTEGLAAGFTVLGIVTGQHAGEMQAMDPEVVTLLVRFLGGERPEATMLMPPTSPGPRFDIPADWQLTHPDEQELEPLPKRHETGRRLTQAERWAAAGMNEDGSPKAPEREDPETPLVLGVQRGSDGASVDLRGVTLP